jgi:hypothetical protein
MLHALLITLAKSSFFGPTSRFDGVNQEGQEHRVSRRPYASSATREDVAPSCPDKAGGLLPRSLQDMPTLSHFRSERKTPFSPKRFHPVGLHSQGREGQEFGCEARLRLTGLLQVSDAVRRGPERSGERITRVEIRRGQAWLFTQSDF